MTSQPSFTHLLSRPLSKVLPLLLVVGLSLGLSACGDKASKASQEPGGMTEDTSAPAPAPATPSPDSASQSTPAADLPSFTPTPNEVRQAMQQLLVQKAMTMPPSEQRDAWFAAESARFAAIQVGKCTTSPIGTPSICHVAVGSKNTQVKILLTRAGWMLVP